MGEQLRNALRFACGTSGKRKLYMLPCDICHMTIGICRSKEVGVCFKVAIWGGNASHKQGRTILMGKGAGVSTV